MKLVDTFTYEEKKSKFLGFLYQFEKDSDCKNVMDQLKKEHADARHILHVARYSNQYGAAVLEASDDKEPISSMKKASRFFERDNTLNIGIFIVRYYGGTQLGASHLDHIYFTIAMKLYEKAKQINIK